MGKTYIYLEPIMGKAHIYLVIMSNMYLTQRWSRAAIGDGGGRRFDSNLTQRWSWAAIGDGVEGQSCEFH
jgi:hypothetical protein